MTRIEKSRSRNSETLRPTFRRVRSEAKGKSAVRLLRKFARVLKARRSRGRGTLRRYSHGAGRVRREISSHAQKVVVKARVVRNTGGSLARHLSYIERDKAGIGGEKGRVFSEGGYLAENQKSEWLNATSEDRHHFRLIVSPENGAALDLEVFGTEFAKSLEHDLGTKLQWLGVVHGNTDNPHVHMIVRGVTEKGSDLVISRSYISHGMRQAASELVTRELGYRSGREVKQEREGTVLQRRFTWLDKKLLEFGEVVDCREQPARKALLIGRLEFLKSEGLAVELDVGVWRVDHDLENKLREKGKRGDIIKQMHELEARGVKIGRLNEGESLEGEVVASSVADELSGRRRVLIEGDNGDSFWIIVPEGTGRRIRKGTRVRVTRDEKLELRTVRGVFLGFEDAWANIKVIGRGERKTGRAVQLSDMERDEEEQNVRRQRVRVEDSERVRSMFLSRVRGKGRER